MRITVPQGSDSLWAQVREHMADVPSFCGGRGICGKCRVKVIEGNASVSAADRRHLTEEEREAGFRIACRSVPLTDCVIEMEAVSEEKLRVLAGVDHCDALPFRKEGYSIAVDIGTTTLAFVLLDREGAVAATETGLNHQRRFGADVVSRITYAMEGHEKELTACIRSDIRQGILRLTKRGGIGLSEVEHIVVAGNTAMEQSFFGIPVDGLGSYPFLPFTKDFLHAEYGQLYSGPEGKEEGAARLRVTGFPCIAGFVGGDITAGLYELTEGQGRAEAVFLDIGTNGELACLHDGRILTASTAAGPVFEGGNISSGMAYLPGAICAVQRSGDRLECATAENESPRGICGSGLIEAVAELLRLGVIDRSGQMHSQWRETGYVLARGADGRNIALTQQDIREFQMAKAAIAAGTELLLGRAGLEEGRISEILLAGGLGNGLSVRKAVSVGLLPKRTERRVHFVGNTSLKGAVRLLRKETCEAGEDRIRGMLARTGHIHLANTEEFSEAYIRHMGF